ncbi:MAG: hypothetical protein A3F70_19410 [Acidobacteria bacterium RIFCSPLOWO2_12_FULL_67_14]|nr:MAG: hypothetical protein A3F70_19410 [Acidobacteria bacterium RIFCSPLOWO2_12_FULL_67_14]
MNGGSSVPALRIPDYRKFFAAGALSMVADNIEHVISHWVPFLLFSFHTGALADRYECRKLIQISQALYVVASASWGLLFLFDALQMWHAVVILLIHGAAGVLAAPAQQLIIHDIVPREQLPSAIRLTASSRYLSILLGPAIGGGLMLLLGPAWGLLTNALIYLPFTFFLLRVPYTGHASAGGPRREPLRFADVATAYAAARSERRIMTIIVLAGVSSFFVGNAFQAQMPEYAQYLGADETGARYSILLAANAAGAIVGVILLESAAVLQASVRNALVCAALWAAAMGLSPLTASYPAAVALLVAAGVFSIAFTSMAQTIVQLLAPAQLRGRLVGLFNTAMLGLRAGAGLTIGIAGSFIGVRLSLALSALAVLVVAVALFARDSRPAMSRRHYDYG